MEPDSNPFTYQGLNKDLDLVFNRSKHPGNRRIRDLFTFLIPRDLGLFMLLINELFGKSYLCEIDLFQMTLFEINVLKIVCLVIQKN